MDVLLIEDCEVDRYIAIGYLENNFVDINISATSNGRQALETLKKETFDLILLDINMSVMNGHEFLKVFSRELISKAPILVLSSSVLQAEKNEVLSYPCVKGFLQKPIINNYEILAEHLDIQHIISAEST